jgi:hypothetical protein
LIHVSTFSQRHFAKDPPGIIFFLGLEGQKLGGDAFYSYSNMPEIA